METNSKLVQLTQTKNRLKQPLSYWLRHELDPDCILEVLKFLSFRDLMSMCQLDGENDQFFTPLINDNVIGKVLVPFEIESYLNGDAKTTLKTFGKSIRRLRITMKYTNFNAVAKMLIAYCSPGRINELQLIMRENYSFGDIDIDWNLMRRAIRYLRGIKHLHIDGSYDRSFGDFCVFVMNKAKNLVTLKLAKFKWENHVDEITIEATKLKELRIDDVKGVENEVLVHLIKKSPKLEVFEFKSNSKYIPKHGEALGKYCPNLRYFIDVTNGDQEDVNRYHFLEKFKDLEVVTISLNSWAADDIRNVHEILINKSLLKKLTMFVNQNCQLVLTYNEPDSCTKSSKLTDAEFYFDEITNIAEWKEFLQSCRSSLDGVCKINIAAKTVYNIHEILELTPHIQEVSIYTSYIHQLPAEVRKIKRVIAKIVENRRNGGQSDKVQFIVNQSQFNEFKVLPKINELITLLEKKTKRKYLCAFNI